MWDRLSQRLFLNLSHCSGVAGSILGILQRVLGRNWSQDLHSPRTEHYFWVFALLCNVRRVPTSGGTYPEATIVEPANDYMLIAASG